MKTEQEIKEKIEITKKKIGNVKSNKSLIDTVDYNMGDLIISVLQWVLEDSESKRTIFDLTEKELTELFFTAFPSLREPNVTLWNYIAREKHGFVEFEIYLDNNDSWYINIFDDLSMYPYFNGENAIVKQADYIDRIREMLSKSKDMDNSDHIADVNKKVGE